MLKSPLFHHVFSYYSISKTPRKNKLILLVRLIPGIRVDYSYSSFKNTGHCVQVPWKYINVCGYSAQFCKLPHTYYVHTTYILRTYYIQNE